MILIKYITNNLNRKKEQTIGCMLSIMIPSLIILMDYAVIHGIERGLKKSINEVISGQLIISYNQDYKMNILESKLNNKKIFEISIYNKKELKTMLPDASINHRIRLGALVSFGDGTSYTNFHALEDNHLKRIGGMLTMYQGKMPDRENEIAISQSLAQDLLCRVGDTLLLLADNINDYMSDALGVVSGIFEEKGLAIFLNYNAFMTYRFGQEIAGIPEGQAVELIVNSIDGTDFSRQEIADIGNYFESLNPELTTVTWNQTVPLMRAVVKVWEGGGIITQVIFISFSLIILVTLTSIVVRLRRKEIGTLLAIGFSWRKIKMLLCSEYLLLTVFAVTTGYLLLNILLLLLPPSGVEVTSEYMQAALMTDKLLPVSGWGDFFYVAFLFAVTATASVLISLRKLRKVTIHSLINQ